MNKKQGFCEQNYCCVPQIKLSLLAAAGAAAVAGVVAQGCVASQKNVVLLVVRFCLVILPDTFTFFESYHHQRRCVLGDFCLGGGPREGGVRGVGEGEVSGGRATAGRGQGGERGAVAAGNDLR